MADDPLPQFIQEVTGESHLRIETDLGDGFVRLSSSEAERRQAKHDIRCVEDIVIEMLRNARDAQAQLIYLATVREGDIRRIVMIDDGAGIPPAMHTAIFEPRVTSKLDTYHMDRWGVHGRGMALYSIRENAQSARVVASEPQKGSSLEVVVDTKALTERADQSSFPRRTVTDDGRAVMRGPRNINRMVAEFVTEKKDAPLVFVGSPIQIAATLYRGGLRALSAQDKSTGCYSGMPASYTGEGIDSKLSSAARGDLPLCFQPALAATPRELAQTCRSIGLDMSERSARRILDGQVEPVPPFLSVLIAQSSAKNGTMRVGSGNDAGNSDGALDHLRHPHDARTLGIARDDLNLLADEVAHAWAPIAQAYYLDTEVRPQVRLSKDGVRIFIPAVHEDR